MKRSIIYSIVIVWCNLLLTGCNLEVDVVGEGEVISESGDVQCADNCRYPAGNGKRTEVLLPQAGEGHEFLSFLDDCSGDQSCTVDFGFFPFCRISTPTTTCPATTLPSPQYRRVQAVFVDSAITAEKHLFENDIACIITIDRGLNCWGDYADQTPQLTGMTELALQADYSCAIADQGLQCWGRDLPGNDLTPFPQLTDPYNLWAGDRHACAQDGNEIYCWGEHYYGQSKVNDALNAVTAMDAGPFITCAIQNGDVTCWGNDNAFEASPTQPSDIHNASLVESGPESACAVHDVNQISCWGAAALDSYRNAVETPTNLVAPIDLAVSRDSACALDQDQVHCWGDDLPGFTQTFTNARKIVADDRNGYCVLDDLGVHCMDSGEPPLRYSLPDDSPHPVDIALIESGDTSAVDLLLCGIAASGEVFCSRNSPYESPTDLALSNPSAIAIGHQHACALTEQGVSCWPDDYSTDGQTNVPELVNPTAISVGNAHSCALDDTGLVCWGEQDDNYDPQP